MYLFSQRNLNYDRNYFSNMAEDVHLHMTKYTNLKNYDPVPKQFNWVIIECDITVTQRNYSTK